MGTRGWFLNLRSTIQSLLNGSARQNPKEKEASAELLLETPGTTEVSDLHETELSQSAKLLLDGSWITRRIESIEVLDENWIERRTSIQISTDRIAEILNLPLDGRHVWIPIGVNRKEYYLKFDLMDASGTSVPLAGRETDSTFGQVALCLLANRSDETFKNSAKTLAYSMAGNPKSLLDLQDSPTEELERLTKLLAHHFCPMINIPLSGGEAVYKMMRVEAHELPPKLQEDTSNPAKEKGDSNEKKEKQDDSSAPAPTEDCTETTITPFPSQALSVDFPYFGWAISEHVRISLPEGTFFSSLFFGSSTTSENVTLSALDRASIYRHEEPTCPDDIRASPKARPASDKAKDYRLTAALMPKKQGALRGTLVLTWYIVSILMTAGAFGLFQYYTTSGLTGGCSESSIFERLRGEPALTLGVVLPSVMVGYFYVSSETRSRHQLLRRWRNLASWSIAPTLLFATYILAAPEESLSSQWTSWVSLALGVCSLTVFAIPVSIWWHRISREMQRQSEKVGSENTDTGGWVTPPSQSTGNRN